MAHVARPSRTSIAHDVALRRFDLDHLGAEVTWDLRRQRSKDDRGQAGDPDPGEGPGFAVCTGAPGSCIVRCRILPRARPDPQEEGDAGDDVPQPALQHLAPSPGAVARERRGADCY